MTTDLDLAHWGVATYVFSLDLSTELAERAIPGCDWKAIRVAARRAILENRAAVHRDGKPLFLREAISSDIDLKASQRAQLFFAWVDTQLVTVSRPKNSITPLNLPLRDAEILSQINTMLDGNSCYNVSYSAMVHNNVDKNASQDLVDAVFRVDTAIDNWDLSDWDKDLIDRNAAYYGRDNPLASLIAALTQILLANAAEKVIAGLGKSDAIIISDLCEKSYIKWHA